MTVDPTFRSPTYDLERLISQGFGTAKDLETDTGYSEDIRIEQSVGYFIK